MNNQILVSLAVDDPSWYDIDVGTDLENFLETMARTAFLSAHTERFTAAEVIDISLVLTNDTQIQRINAEYRGKDTPTNVLSFPALSKDDVITEQTAEFLPLGDVILAKETILREAQQQNKKIDAHIAHMIVHGVLHLLGYDHEDDSDAQHMENLETQILTGLGFDAPYSDEEGTHETPFIEPIPTTKHSGE